MWHFTKTKHLFWQVWFLGKGANRRIRQISYVSIGTAEPGPVPGVSHAVPHWFWFSSSVHSPTTGIRGYQVVRAKAPQMQEFLRQRPEASTAFTDLAISRAWRLYGFRDSLALLLPVLYAIPGSCTCFPGTYYLGYWSRENALKGLPFGYLGGKGLLANLQKYG